MAKYEVKFYAGDYPARQRAANADQAICYVEQHFNCSESRSANYTLAVVASNASGRSKDWGHAYTKAIAREFGIADNGVSVGGFGGRGNVNLMYTSMPAVLLEPFFISNPKGSQWAEDRCEDLARILAESIRQFFPNGGLVAFSIGHLGKTSSPNDRGAQAVSGKWEADLARTVLKRAETLLEQAVEDPVHAEEHPILADDVSDWAKAAQEWVRAKKISDGARPQAPVTREELWVMLHRALGKD
jgi:hypothetical protein